MKQKVRLIREKQLKQVLIKMFGLQITSKTPKFIPSRHNDLMKFSVFVRHFLEFFWIFSDFFFFAL